MRTRLLLPIAVLASLALPAAADALTPSRDANAVAGAMDSFQGAAFTAIPPAPSRPAGIGNALQAGFPTSGKTYAVLSTGDAAVADSPNGSGNTSSTNGSGPGPHGTLTYDLVQIRVDFV